MGVGVHALAACPAALALFTGHFVKALFLPFVL